MFGFSDFPGRIYHSWQPVGAGCSFFALFYLLFTLIGLRVQAGVVTNRGRIDSVVELNEAIYLFEFKLNGSERDAFTQIRTMTYFERYQNKGKPIHLVGVNFSTRKRGVAKWLNDDRMTR